VFFLTYYANSSKEILVYNWMNETEAEGKMNAILNASAMSVYT
jgi:hypothetical protein